MKPTLRLLRLKDWSIFKQLQLEEALLRADQSNWCVLNENSTDAIVMGISGKPHELIHLEAHTHNPVPVIRRFSGGGCVYVDQDTLFVSFIINQCNAPVDPFPQQILCWTKEIYHPLFPNYDFCVRENDYVLGEHKFGGNAQYIIKNRWLHHSSLLWDYCPQKMNRLTLPPKMPGYREMRTHKDFLCTLEPLFNNRAEFWDKLLHSLSSRFTVVATPVEEALDTLNRPHRRATTLIEIGHYAK
jgi:lipoate---protein ligase